MGPRAIEKRKCISVATRHVGSSRTTHSSSSGDSILETMASPPAAGLSRGPSASVAMVTTGVGESPSLCWVSSVIGCDEVTGSWEMVLSTAVMGFEDDVMVMSSELLEVVRAGQKCVCVCVLKSGHLNISPIRTPLIRTPHQSGHLTNPDTSPIRTPH